MDKLYDMFKETKKHGVNLKQQKYINDIDTTLNKSIYAQRDAKKEMKRIIAQ